MAMANNEERKNHELNDEELEGVTGGTGANGDGTYSFNAGDCFSLPMAGSQILTSRKAVSIASRQGCNSLGSS